LLGQNDALVLGKAVAVMLASPRHRAMPLGDLFAQLAPAIKLKQIAIAEARPQGSESENVVPIGLVMWATLSEEVEQRLLADESRKFRLRPEDWRSGDRPWLLEALGPQKAVVEMIKQVVAGPLKGRPLKVQRRSPDGKSVTVEEFKV
jgi:cytolysin-activating lysine-acyltransferase